MDGDEHCKGYGPSFGGIGQYQEDKENSVRHLLKDCYLHLSRSAGNTPLFTSSRNSSATDSIDVELRIAEAKERMKQMLHESQDICRKLNFQFEATSQADGEISPDPHLNIQRSPLSCSSEQKKGGFNLISFDDFNNEDDYFSHLTSKYFPVEVASQPLVPELHEVGNGLKPGSIKRGKELLIYEGEDDFDKIASVGENKQNVHKLIFNHDEHDSIDFERTATKSESDSEVENLSRQVQVLVDQLMGCRRNLLTAEREVNLLHEENRELRGLIRDILLVQGYKPVKR